MFYTEPIKDKEEDKEEDKEDKKKKGKKKKKRKLDELVRSEEVVVEQVRFENTHQIRLFLVFVNILKLCYHLLFKKSDDSCMTFL